MLGEIETPGMNSGGEEDILSSNEAKDSCSDNDSDNDAHETDSSEVE